MINSTPEQRFIYVAPFLREVQRILDSTGSNRFVQPEYYDKDEETGLSIHSTKSQSLMTLLLQKRDVAMTHSCFLKSWEQMEAVLKVGEYVLVIDEAPDLVQRFNATTGVADDERQNVKDDDLERLHASGYISISPDDGQVRWVGPSWKQFSEMKRMCDKGQLYSPREEMLLCVFPPEVFALFKDIYLMTYLFHTTISRAYFKKYEIPYILHSVEKTDSGYQLSDWSIEKELSFREEMKSLITIHGGDERYTSGMLSKTWFQNTDSSKIEELSGKMGYFFRYIADAKAKDAMWTCPKDYEQKLQCKGYKYPYRLRKVDPKLPPEERKRIQKEQSDSREKQRCFLPCNARGTNNYQDRWALAYCMNLYPPTDIEAFFTDYDVPFSRNEFALQSLIQWIFRSRIRNGQPIQLFLPSLRMEKILVDWLNGADLIIPQVA